MSANPIPPPTGNGTFETTPHYFGRIWKISIEVAATGETITAEVKDWQTDGLRMTFAVKQTVNTWYWWADVELYNFNAGSDLLIAKNDVVTIEAGYQQPGSGVIFKGRVFQPIWERVGECDYRLALHCLVGLYEDETAHVSYTAAKGVSYGKAIEDVCILGGVNPAAIDPSLYQKTYESAMSFYGRVLEFATGIARDTQMNAWMSWRGLNVRPVGPNTIEGDPDVVYAPPYSSSHVAFSGDQGALVKYTLIGTPTQTEAGISFRVLLDSAVELCSVVQIDNALITQVRYLPGQNKPFTADNKTKFIVAGISHCGDSRGQEWYTEIDAVIPGWQKLFEKTAN